MVSLESFTYHIRQQYWHQVPLAFCIRSTFARFLTSRYSQCQCAAPARVLTENCKMPEQRVTKRKTSAAGSAKDTPEGSTQRATSQASQTDKHNAAHIAHEHDDEANPFVVFMIFNVLVAAFLYAVYYVVQHPNFMVSCTPDQPLVNITDNFLQDDMFSNLTKCLAEHPLVLGNELSESNFKDTRGFVIKFSEKGIDDFRKHRYFACLAPYFDVVRLPDTNAFVMNLLMCELSHGNKDGVAVGLHLDNTIGIQSWRYFLAHQVNVLYAFVPDDMVGGGKCRLHLVASAVSGQVCLELASVPCFPENS